MEKTIITKFVFVDQETKLEVFVDQANGNLVIETQKEVIEIPNSSAYSLLKNSAQEVLLWQEEEKRKIRKKNKFFRFFVF